MLNDQGAPIKISGTRQRGLLALLAIKSPAMVSTGVIVKALGEGDGASRPDAALHMSMSRLRSAIGEDAIATKPGGYTLDIPVGQLGHQSFPQSGHSWPTTRDIGGIPTRGASGSARLSLNGEALCWPISGSSSSPSRLPVNSTRNGWRRSSG